MAVHHGDDGPRRLLAVKVGGEHPEELGYQRASQIIVHFLLVSTFRKTSSVIMPFSATSTCHEPLLSPGSRSGSCGFRFPKGMLFDSK